ncbi:LpqB family beta-propeller domain-containing protein [Streptomyces sp. TRM68367]|uniref:LpqB family beta-propeller domain-containing protein n=1 Tax=Streptomyces sp. TRM68367 TaxID=2758415 RepID=UPI00165B98FD|nr:LpqB family beta-propeller domain-containing protein [Streptomyces sp. TRM68367]MBC9725470.1 GerMN domain-containing protein [Streptomyces sp. TRM68367]
MGADRKGGGRRSRAHAMAYAACGVVLLAGCASMPDSGDLRGVESTPRQDSQVRVFAVPPRDDASYTDIVQGFLEALTSDEPDYKTARMYLTDKAARTWRPKQSTTVLVDGPGLRAGSPADREDVGEYSYLLTGTKVATVNAQQAYTPASGSYNESVHLTRNPKNGQWRIDSVPQGVVMGKSDFQRNYMSVNKYYFATNSESVATGGQPMAVADPVYVRRRVDPMTQTVRSLLDGPTSWLRPVVRSSFPTGTALEKDAAPLTPDDRNRLTVPLNDRAAKAGTGICEEMAAQLLFTLRSLAPSMDEVALRTGRAELCSLTEERAEAVAMRGASQHPDYLYFVDGKHRLVRLGTGSSATRIEPVPGALGEGGTALRSVAVSYDERSAAGVTLDSKSLYVGSLESGGTLGKAVVHSGGKAEEDRLTTPSWDARGDLWVADRNPADPRLLMLEDGSGEPLEVATPGLDGRVQAVRVAADGVRIALVVEKNGRQSLLIGRAERVEETGGRLDVTVRELRSVTPELEEVKAISWAGDSRLVVVGRSPGGVEQMQYMQCDGSMSESGSLPSLTEVKSVAASESSDLPLLAASKEGVLRLSGGRGWKTVHETGTAVVYPG